MTSSASSSSKKKSVSVVYGPDGEILCKCKEPAREFTVKKEGINKGRDFLKCSKDQNDESKCEIFIWQDEVILPTAAQLAKFGSHRLEDESNPSPSPPGTPSSSNKRKSTSSSQAVVIPDDDDDDDAEAELQAEQDRALAREKRLNNSGINRGRLMTPSPSPTKKMRTEVMDNNGGEGKIVAPKFSSFSSPTSSGSKSQHQSIIEDADSPFHTLQKKLFGTTSFSLSQSHQPSPSTSQIQKTSISTSSQLSESPSSNFSSDKGDFDEVIESISSLKKESEKKDRLLVAAGKRSDFLVGQVAKLKIEVETASKKARLLEEENEELRSRYE